MLAIPGALGTGIIIRADAPINPEVRAFVRDYERVLSRFRSDSLVAAMAEAPHGGSFDFPDWAGGLFNLYDRLVEATDGAIDPCIGEDLIRLGYSADLVFDGGSERTDEIGSPSHEAAPQTDRRPNTTDTTSGSSASPNDAADSLRPHSTWRDDVERHGTTLITRRPVHLDFGACGKGYLVDLLARMMTTPQFVIDAGGDLLIHTNTPLTIAMEDPQNTKRAVGTAKAAHAAFCASAPSRRHWQTANGDQVHHLLNAIDGQPVQDVAATWVTVNATPHYPTALADGLATALFVTDPNRLARHFRFECVVLNADRTALSSRRFPGALFTQRSACKS